MILDLLTRSQTVFLWGHWHVIGKKAQAGGSLGMEQDLFSWHCHRDKDRDISSLIPSALQTPPPKPITNKVNPTCSLTEPSCKDIGVFHKAFATGFTKLLCGKRCETNRNGGSHCHVLALCCSCPPALHSLFCCLGPAPAHVLGKVNSFPLAGAVQAIRKKKKVNNKDKSFDYRATEFARHRESWGEINVAKPEFPGSTGFPANRIHTSLPTSANNAGSCQGTGERKGKHHRSAKPGLSSTISDTTFKQLHPCVSGVPCPPCSHNSHHSEASVGAPVSPSAQHV